MSLYQTIFLFCVIFILTIHRGTHDLVVQILRLDVFEQYVEVNSVCTLVVRHEVGFAHSLPSVLEKCGLRHLFSSAFGNVELSACRYVVFYVYTPNDVFLTPSNCY